MDENFSEKEIIEKRKKELIAFVKNKKTWIYYIILAIITFIGVYIRTKNIDKLKDVTTGTWTLGPDLDPFLFLRWAEYIIENGSLFALDAMRNVPLGHNTAAEMKLLSYLIAWFHQVLSVFSLTDSVTYSAIIFPVFMFALTTIAFFLFSRKIFYKEKDWIKNSIALLATLLFVLVPSLLPRTIAGIPEKESAAFFFMFLAFYFFLESFTNKNFKKASIFAVLAGLSTGLMALIWGGYIFIFFAIGPTFAIYFLIGKVKKKEFYLYCFWLLSSVLLMITFSTRYTVKTLITSTAVGPCIFLIFLVGISLILMKQKKIISLSQKYKIPKELLCFIILSLILLIFVFIFLGPSFILGQIENIKNSLIQPATNRFNLTVAENKQPYYSNEWKNYFGPIYFNLPLYFWLFFVGSIFLFYNLIKCLSKKDRIYLTLAYGLFLTFLIFSRYSPESVLNGLNKLSLFAYFLGWIILLFVIFKIYRKKYIKGNFGILKKINIGHILYFVVLTFAIIGARGGVRLIMVLGAVSPIAISFLNIKLIKKAYSQKDENIKLILIVIAGIILIASLITIYDNFNSNKIQAENFAPGTYHQQWQRAMNWVRENTPETIIENEKFVGGSVFAHWWDYGYWVQSIGERATVLDGGNAIIYWNHLMGRHVLTEIDQTKSLEFLYAHNVTHLLIDSTEIGKYTAYSSIGADENYDRFSWIPSFVLDESKIVEQRNITLFPYFGGSNTDEDIVWKNNEGEEIFLPAKKTQIGGIISSKDAQGNYFQPQMIFVYNNRQYNLPIKYMYIEAEEKKLEFENGLEAGIFVFPKLNIANNQVSSQENGAALYLSPRVVNSNLARLFLFSEENKNFVLAHSEENEIVQSLKQQGLALNEFVYYQGLQGPIKIWDVNYPSNIEFKEEFLEKEYPDENLQTIKPGEY